MILVRSLALAGTFVALLTASVAMADENDPAAPAASASPASPASNDSAAIAPSAMVTAAPAAQPDTTAPTPQRYARPIGLDRDRVELGAAVVSGPFDMLATLGYHRYARCRLCPRS